MDQPLWARSIHVGDVVNFRAYNFTNWLGVLYGQILRNSCKWLTKFYSQVAIFYIEHR